MTMTGRCSCPISDNLSGSPGLRGTNPHCRLHGDLVPFDYVPRDRAGEILAEAARTIGAGGDRQANYGDALDNFTAIGKLWAVVLGVDEVTAEQVALCMNQVKVARLLHSPAHHDSWVDGIGYMALGGAIAETPGRH